MHFYTEKGSKQEPCDKVKRKHNYAGPKQLIVTQAGESLPPSGLRG